MDTATHRRGADRDQHVTLRLWGLEALWTPAHVRANPYSYPVPTYSALKGVLRAIYWKPPFEYEPLWVSVLKPIRYETRSMIGVVNTLAQADKDPDGNGGRTRYTQSILWDVDYVVRARLVKNPHYPHKTLHAYHQEILRRMRRGEQYGPLYMGKSEFAANYELIEEGDELPAPQPITMDLGSMLFDQIPLQLGSWRSRRRWRKRKAAGRKVSKREPWKQELMPVFHKATMQGGVVHFPADLMDRYRDQIFEARAKTHQDTRGDHVAA